MISCILLSAGESRRFGSPKALAPVGKSTALAAIQQTILDAGVDEIIVVLGAHSGAVGSEVFNHTKVRVVYNKDYKLGQTSSFQAGVRSVDEKALGYMLWPVDCPWIGVQTVRELLRDFNQNHPAILVPAFQGHRGHPPVFNGALRREILSMPAHSGVNALFERFSPAVLELQDQGILKTFNTKEELGSMKKTLDA